MARAQLWAAGTSLALTPSAPANVTSVTADAAATVSFLAPSPGAAPVTSWTVTPYIAGAAQSPTTVSTGSAGSITGSDGNTYVQVPVTGLANSTAYTFTARASNAYGPGPESARSGANTPLSGLVFGDDFNGPASGPIDPEWWVYNRCGYLAQSETEYYLPDHCALDGAGNLQLTAEKSSYTGPKYASAGGGSVTQPWRSGACQSNTRTYIPTSGNTMTFESRFQVCPDVALGMWPGLFWLEGQQYLTQWKTDPQQGGWNNTTAAEIDIAEFNAGNPTTQYLASVNAGAGWDSITVNGTDFAASMNVFSAQWKPGASIHWLLNGSTARTAATTNIPTTGCQFFLLLYLQILTTTTTATQHCSIDYVRVYDLP